VCPQSADFEVGDTAGSEACAACLRAAARVQGIGAEGPNISITRKPSVNRHKRLHGGSMLQFVVEAMSWFSG
jgi:hypothetical protein